MKVVRLPVSILFIVFVPTGWLVAREEGPGRLELKLPAEVRNGLTPPRVQGDVDRRPTGKALEAALVFRDETPRVFVNGKLRGWPAATAELARFAKAGRAPVILFADQDASFGPVQWFLMACSHPDVRLRRLHLGVRTAGGEGVLPVPLPTGSASKDPQTDFPKSTIRLIREADDEPLEVKLDGYGLGTGEQGFRALERAFSRFEWSSESPLEVAVAPFVPHRDVVRLLVLLRKKKCKDIRLLWTVPPPALAEPVWRVPEKVRSEIALPPARTGESPAPDSPLLEVAVMRGVNGFFADGGEHTLEGLRQILVAHSLERRDREDPRKLSRLSVLVLAHADRGWWHIQSVFSLCAEDGVRAPWVHLAVRRGEKQQVIPVWLPTGAPPEGTAFLTVHLDGGGGMPTTVKRKDDLLGAGKEGFEKLGATLQSIRRRFPDKVIHGQVSLAKFVPYGDVVAAVDEFRAAGITNLRFIPR